MPLTTDHVQAAFADLAAGRIPDLSDLAELVAAIRRMQAGMSFDAATGAAGPIATKERNAAITEMAAGLDGSTWAQAETVRLRLQLTPTTDAARDAIALKADGLTRDMIYRILRDAIPDEPGQNQSIENG